MTRPLLRRAHRMADQGRRRSPPARHLLRLQLLPHASRDGGSSAFAFQLQSQLCLHPCTGPSAFDAPRSDAQYAASRRPCHHSGWVRMNPNLLLQDIMMYDLQAACWTSSITGDTIPVIEKVTPGQDADAEPQSWMLHRRHGCRKAPLRRPMPERGCWEADYLSIAPISATPDDGRGRRRWSSRTSRTVLESSRA